jgi:hypothetical protein
MILGDEVDSSGVKRMAAQDTPRREHRAPAGAVPQEGLGGVHAAAGPETAVPSENRRQQQPVGLNQQQEQPRSHARRAGRVAATAR